MNLSNNDQNGSKTSTPTSSITNKSSNYKTTNTVKLCEIVSIFSIIMLKILRLKNVIYK